MFALGKSVPAGTYLEGQQALDVLVVSLHARNASLPQQFVWVHAVPGAWCALKHLHLEARVDGSEELQAQGMHLGGALLQRHPGHVQPFQDASKITGWVAKAHGHGGRLDAAQQGEEGREDPGLEHDVSVVGGVEF